MGIKEFRQDYPDDILLREKIRAELLLDRVQGGNATPYALLAREYIKAGRDELLKVTAALQELTKDLPPDPEIVFTEEEIRTIFTGYAAIVLGVTIPFLEQAEQTGVFDVAGFLQSHNDALEGIGKISIDGYGTVAQVKRMTVQHIPEQAVTVFDGRIATPLLEEKLSKINLIRKYAQQDPSQAVFFTYEAIDCLPLAVRIVMKQSGVYPYIVNEIIPDYEEKARALEDLA